MFSHENEIAIMITDSSEDNIDEVARYVAMSKEGYNLAFITNTGSSAGCPQGLTCALEQLGNTLLAGYDQVLREELPLFERFSLEEYQLLRPTINSRHQKVVKHFRVIIDNELFQGGEEDKAIHGD